MVIFVCWTRSSAIVTLLCCMACWAPCDGQTIDEIISRAMKSPSGYGLMQDAASNTVRVDMDMIFSIQDWHRIISLNDSYEYYGPYKRQATKGGAGAARWTNGLIPYEIDSYDFRDRVDTQPLYDAIDDWMQYTCVRFVPANTMSYIINKIRFVDGDGCSSNVGMVGKTQKVTLGSGCRMKGVVLHELGHVLGFHHEQTRPDRDEYVRVMYDNIPDHMEYNFKKYTWAVIKDLGVLYNYLSVMHYGSKSFSDNGRNTIETVDRYYQDQIGNREGLSFRDIKSANLLYECRPANCHLRDSDCPGEGFVSKDCECWCPSSKPYGQNPYVVCRPGDTSHGNNNGGNNNQEPPCEDRNPNCGYWQSRGECSLNSLYMHDYCRRACGLCGLATSRCDDKYPVKTCVYWRKQGYCRVASDYSSFMAFNCRLTCGFCQISQDVTTTTTSTESPPPVTVARPCERQCRDEHDSCQTWALRGECTATPDYMLRHCRKTCNSCCQRLRH